MKRFNFADAARSLAAGVPVQTNGRSPKAKATKPASGVARSDVGAIKKAARDEGFEAGRRVERRRCCAIFDAAGPGREATARRIALETDLPAEQAVALLPSFETASDDAAAERVLKTRGGRRRGR